MRPSDISRWQGSVDSWLAQNCVSGKILAPAGGTVVCDTGMLGAGWYDFAVLTTLTIAHVYGQIEHRNTPNDDNVYVWYVLWGGYKPVMLPIKSWYVSANERLRLVIYNASAGTVTANIHWTKRV